MQFLRVCKVCLQSHGKCPPIIRNIRSGSRVSSKTMKTKNRAELVVTDDDHLGHVVTQRCFNAKSQSLVSQFLSVGRRLGNDLPHERRQHFSSSTLYTPNSEGDHVPFILNPEIDLEGLFSELSELEKNVNARGQEVNLSNLVALWEKLQLLEQEKIRIEGERSKVNKQSKLLNKSGSGTKEQKQELQQMGRSLRENVRQINASVAELSDEFYPSALLLPNSLHPDVPHGSKRQVLETFGSKPEMIENESAQRQQSDHLQESSFGVHAGYAYLHHEAALMEIALTQWAGQELTHQGFVPFSCPAMFKPIALEALGMKPDSTNETYAVETHESLQYLTGVSPLAFIAYYMMSVMEAADLPYRGFTIGRSYNSLKESSHFEGLHQNFQTQKVELCGVCENTEVASGALFTQFLGTARDLLATLPLHYRVVAVPSTQLLPSMHRKYAIEVWIPNIDEFSEVACVYSCTDYISRRVKMRYPAIPSQTAAQSRHRNFLHTVHCTALDTTVLLAALLPIQQVPDVLEPYMPKTSST